MFLGGSAIVTTPEDVLPDVNIPVVSVVWTYTGLSAKEMENRVTTYTEFALSNSVNGIKNIESLTLQGIAVEKVFFQPNVSIDLAIAQVVSAMNSIRALLPPGINPPTVQQYSASSVAVIQLAMSGESEEKLYDYGNYRLRQAISQVPGSSLPTPSGGKLREVIIDLNLHALQGYGLTPSQVTSAILAQNVTLPSGEVKFGNLQYVVKLNDSPSAVDTFNSFPVAMVNGAPVLIRDIAHVRDGFQVQQNIVRSNGSRAVLMDVLKNGNASTLSVVDNVKQLLPGLKAAAPKDLVVTPLFDQSVLVTSSISDVVTEGCIAAGLTGLMILLFLGSWRSTLIVMISIPLAILSSLVVLSALGATINVMTLGGLALAVGILVDDATVAIENTYRLLEEGRDFPHAVVEGAAGIAKPALVSTLAICCAFVAVLFLTDAAKYLFTPQALAVVFAMLASYGLSRTLVPVLADILIAGEQHGKDKASPPKPGIRGFFGRFNAGFERVFKRFRVGYGKLLRIVLGNRLGTSLVIATVLASGAGVFTFVGRDYFPQIDTGEMQLHVRARSGLRIENAEEFFQKVDDTIRSVVPAKYLGLVLDNIGLPSNNYNFAFGIVDSTAYYDGTILVSLNKGHAPSADYMRVLRTKLRQQFPEGVFYFEAADFVTQVLDFGLPSPIDIQIVGQDATGNLKVMQRLLDQVLKVRGIVDAHIQQIVDAPQYLLDVDRDRALQFGLTEEQVSTNLNISLASSYQTQPSFWVDPTSGIPYNVAVQTPEYLVSKMSDLMNTPLTSSTNGTTTLLSNVSSLTREGSQVVINHSNVEPVFDIYANVQDRDLASVATDLQRLVVAVQKKLPAGNHITIAGQIVSMESAFSHIGTGLAVALLFVYLLMAINYQSWGDPFVVIAGLPIAFCGICVALLATSTTLSIPSLMGAIMSVGVASSNSILLITFAREHRDSTGCSASEAAIQAGETRLRPILMTAIAMFVGLTPMALGLGAGSEQNAALARAVLGGVSFGTCSTLLFVPFLYTVLRSGAPKPVQDYIQDAT